MSIKFCKMKVKTFLSLLIFIGFSQAIDAQKSDLTGVVIGTQIWMSTNLEETRFRNGDVIPQAQTDEEWQEAGFAKKPAWCYYNDYVDEGSVIVKRGKLYNSFAVNDPRGLAPLGWHIPKESDWMILETFMKKEESGIVGLLSSGSWPGNYSNWNSTGMNVSPDGWRDVGCGGLDMNVTFWGARIDSTETLTVGFDPEEDSVGVNYGSTSWIMGHYVRCVKD